MSSTRSAAVGIADATASAATPPVGASGSGGASAATDVARVSSLCRLLAALHTPANGLGVTAHPRGAAASAADTGAGSFNSGYARVLECTFAFAAVWSIGATLNEGGRRRFNEVRVGYTIFAATIDSTW